MPIAASQPSGLTPQKLFDWANAYARRQERAGHGTQYPTFRQASRRFRTTLDEIELAVDGHIGEGYLGAGVALAVSGVGSRAISPRGDYLVEAYL